MSIFDKFTKEALMEYLSNYASLSKIDTDRAYDLALSAIRYYKGDKAERKNLRPYQELEERWYSSLKAGVPDYSVYDDPYILSDLWACWVVYSRGYLRTINSPKSLRGRSIVKDIGTPNIVVDLGCGIGYTTAGLKELFPHSKVYGTNIETSCQYGVASRIGDKYGFRLIPDIHSLKEKGGLIFASEYFEHIENAGEHLIEIIETCQPDCFITANAFNAISLGHFHSYRFNEKHYSGKVTSKLFGNIMRNRGYTKIETNCWNSRPTYWKRK